MSKVHLVISDQHADPRFHNNRADWLGKFLLDVRPDVVVNIGDGWDLSSLSSYDKGKASFHGRSYRKDIDSGLEFQERMWAPIRKAKRKLPYSYYLIGNHEERISRVLESTPELEGTISYGDLELERYYDEVIPYDGGTPGKVEVDGVWYAHYFTSGIKGLAVSGVNHARSLLDKMHVSCTVGHSHLADYAIESKPNGDKIQATVCGVYQDYRSPWAGASNDLWSRCLVLKREVENGNYDVQFISLKALEKEYGN